MRHEDMNHDASGLFCNSGVLQIFRISCGALLFVHNIFKQIDTKFVDFEY